MWLIVNRDIPSLQRSASRSDAVVLQYQLFRHGCVFDALADFAVDEILYYFFVVPVHQVIADITLPDTESLLVV